MLIEMEVDPVTGLTRAEEITIELTLKSFFSKNNIGPMLSPFYASYARTIYRKTTGEAQQILNDWSMKGLDRNNLITIAKEVCNKGLI